MLPNDRHSSNDESQLSLHDYADRLRVRLQQAGESAVACAAAI